MNYAGQLVFSSIVLGLGIGFISLMIHLKQPAEQEPQNDFLPQVQSFETKAFTSAVPISSQGTVRAFRETEISAEVDGQILSLSDSFLSGHFVKKGETLITIDPEPYQLALNAAKTQLAQAELGLAQEQARADQAKADWLSLDRAIEDASDLVLRKPQIELAQTNIAAAQAQIRLAERRLERCIIKAPYDGFIESTKAGVGQFIRGGSILGRMIDSSKVEIALPVLNQDMAFLQLPKDHNTSNIVTITGNIGQQVHQWEAKLTRLVPRIGERNQQFICIAEVEKPFDGQLPLLPNLFIEARITGITPKGVIEIPRDAVHEGDYVWVIDQEHKISRKDVQITRYNNQALAINYPGETVLIGKGLDVGELICVTRLPVMSIDMKVDPVKNSTDE